jgi:hypothetical protein
MPLEFSFDREAHRRERLAFIREYAAWVKRSPNAEWSRKQGELIDSFMENARNMPLSSKVYLERVIRPSEKKRPSPPCSGAGKPAISGKTVFY